MIYQELSQKVMEVYEELDEEIDRFKYETGAKCIENCGNCCNKKDVEDTVLSFIPLALDLWHKGEADYWLTKLEKKGEDTTCVFFKRDEKDIKNGRCMIYQKRGLICRLFGFAGNKGKNGEKVYPACSVLKKEQPLLVETIKNAINSGAFIPLMTDYAMKMAGIDSNLGYQRYPINEAVKYAIEKVGMQYYYCGGYINPTTTGYPTDRIL